MTETIAIKVNGKVHQAEIDPTTPLLYLLRNNFQLNSPKYGCGLGQCGSCMVLMDGNAIPSCMIPSGEVMDKEIITLEGLGDTKSPDPLQLAFMEEQAAQCGYCISGMIIAAKELLEENKEPSIAEIKTALDRVLCRCGSHSRIIKAVKNASERTKP